MSSNAYRILLVDDEPATLWALSQFLKSAGYDVLQAGAGQQALAALDYYRPHFVIAGWDIAEMSGAEFCRRLRSRNLADYCYVLLLTSTTDSNALIEALQAGADDFLASPPVHGELLSRLRAGARMVEYERRLKQLRRADAETEAATRLVFDEALPRRLAAAAGRGATLSCVLADVDCFRRVNYLHGQAVAEETLRTLVARLQEQCETGDAVYRIGDNRFAMLHEGASETDAAAWADRCRRAIAAADWTLGQESAKLTVSFGVAAVGPSTSAAAALNLAEQALGVAKQSGRNRVVAASQSSAITASRACGVADPLRSAVARDIMTSNVVSFTRHETLESASEFLQACQLSALPVIDSDGQLLGVVTKTELAEHLAAPSVTTRTLGEILATEAPCYEEEATVQTLFEFFQHNEADRVEIVLSGRPTGFVTRGSLAALGKPLQAEDFASPAVAADRSDYLLVPDLAFVETVE